MSNYRTPYVKMMMWRIGWDRFYFILPTTFVILLFLPNYSFKYGGVSNALDRMGFEIEQEWENILKERGIQ